MLDLSQMQAKLESQFKQFTIHETEWETIRSFCEKGQNVIKMTDWGREHNRLLQIKNGKMQQCFENLFCSCWQCFFNETTKIHEMHVLHL